MLHEIVQCLLGNVGGLFRVVDAPTQGVARVALVENLEMLHPSEVEICNRLAELGAMYRRLRAFTDRHALGRRSAAASTEPADDSGGVKCEALSFSTSSSQFVA